MTHGLALSRPPKRDLRAEAELERWTSLVLYWRLVEGLSMADAWDAANEEAEDLPPVTLHVPPPPPSHVRPLEGYVRIEHESPAERRVRIDDEHARRRLEGVELERAPRSQGRPRQTDEERLAKQREYDRSRRIDAKWRYCSRCARMVKGHRTGTCPNTEARQA